MILSRGIFLLCVSFLLSFSGSEDLEIRKGKDHAVFFAVNDYKDRGWDDLKTPIKDAKAIAKLLEDKYDFSTTVIQNPKKREINRKLLELSERSYRDDEQLLIFFTGHGDFFSEPGEETNGLGYFIPSDGEANDDLQILLFHD